MEYEKIIQLINDFGNSKLNNLKLDFPDGTKIDMSKNEEKVKIIETSTDLNKELQNEVEVTENAKEKNNLNSGNIITSPMVGTFYLKPSPNAEPYVKVGQRVKKGDVLCIIEAMKLMNEIESEYDGVVEEILVKDSESVEYGKPLFRISWKETVPVEKETIISWKETDPMKKETVLLRKKRGR